MRSHCLTHVHIIPRSFLRPVPLLHWRLPHHCPRPYPPHCPPLSPATAPPRSWSSSETLAQLRCHLLPLPLPPWRAPRSWSHRPSSPSPLPRPLTGDHLSHRPSICLLELGRRGGETGDRGSDGEEMNLPRNPNSGLQVQRAHCLQRQKASVGTLATGVGEAECKRLGSSVSHRL